MDRGLLHFRIPLSACSSCSFHLGFLSPSYYYILYTKLSPLASLRCVKGCESSTSSVRNQVNRQPWSLSCNTRRVILSSPNENMLFSSTLDQSCDISQIFMVFILVIFCRVIVKENALTDSLHLFANPVTQTSISVRN